MAVGGVGGIDYASLYSSNNSNSGGVRAAVADTAVSMGAVMVDSVELQSEMALKLLKAGAQQQVAVQQMEFTQQIVDMYI